MVKPQFRPVSPSSHIGPSYIGIFKTDQVGTISFSLLSLLSDLVVPSFFFSYFSCLTLIYSSSKLAYTCQIDNQSINQVDKCQSFIELVNHCGDSLNLGSIRLLFSNNAHKRIWWSEWPFKVAIKPDKTDTLKHLCDPHVSNLFWNAFTFWHSISNDALI